MRPVADDSNLENLLENIVEGLAPLCEVRADPLAGTITGPVDVVSMPLALARPTLAANGHLTKNPLVIVVDVRNTGTADVERIMVNRHESLEDFSRNRSRASSQ